jgi:CubicO group peptidase (beta-lactamase class C family)
MAGEGSFGHYGMGGSVGFVHPELGLASAYVTNKMRSSTGVDPRPDALVQATLACMR